MMFKGLTYLFTANHRLNLPLLPAIQILLIASQVTCQLRLLLGSSNMKSMYHRVSLIVRNVQWEPTPVREQTENGSSRPTE